MSCEGEEEDEDEKAEDIKEARTSDPGRGSSRRGGFVCTKQLQDIRPVAQEQKKEKGGRRAVGAEEEQRSNRRERACVRVCAVDDVRTMEQQ